MTGRGGALGSLRCCGTALKASKACRTSASDGLAENCTETVSVCPSTTPTRLQCALTRVAGLGEGALDIGCHRGVHGGKQQARGIAGLAIVHFQIGHRVRGDAQVPGHGVAIPLAGRAIAGAEPRELEPRMALQKFDEMLA